MTDQYAGLRDKKFMKSFIGENMLACRCSCLNNSINKKKIRNITPTTATSGFNGGQGGVELLKM